MSKPKFLVILVFLTVLTAPFTVGGAGPKTYLGVSGISFDYTPFWYAKDYRLYQKTRLQGHKVAGSGLALTHFHSFCLAKYQAVVQTVQMFKLASGLFQKPVGVYSTDLRGSAAGRRISGRHLFPTA